MWLFILGNVTEALPPCPCNSSKNCFSVEQNGIEVCGCFPGYELDGESNETCLGIL